MYDQLSLFHYNNVHYGKSSSSTNSQASLWITFSVISIHNNISIFRHKMFIKRNIIYNFHPFNIQLYTIKIKRSFPLTFVHIQQQQKKLSQQMGRYIQKDLTLWLLLLLHNFFLACLLDNTAAHKFSFFLF